MEFAVGDWVWLRLLHHPTHSLVPGTRVKLGPRYVGPYQVTERIGPVAYAFSCRRAPGCTTCFTSECSSRSTVSHLHRRHLYRRFVMAALYSSRNMPCVPAFAVVSSTF
jgi:hypothetical protein